MFRLSTRCVGYGTLDGRGQEDFPGGRTNICPSKSISMPTIHLIAEWNAHSNSTLAFARRVHNDLLARANSLACPNGHDQERFPEACILIFPHDEDHIRIKDDGTCCHDHFMQLARLRHQE